MQGIFRALVERGGCCCGNSLLADGDLQSILRILSDFPKGWHFSEFASGDHPGEGCWGDEDARECAEMPVEPSG